MKDTLKEAFEKFGTSRAVFVSSAKSATTIEFTTKEPYDPSVGIPSSNIIESMLADNYHESFDKHAKKFVKQDATQTVLRNMYLGIKKAFESASPLKNPSQSKLYKWMDCDTMTSTLERREGLISLFLYVEANTMKDFRFKDGSDNLHAKNLVAILEKMKEKYEQR